MSELNVSNLFMSELNVSNLFMIELNLSNLFRKLFPFLIVLGMLTSLAPVSTAYAADEETAYVAVNALNLCSGPALDKSILRVLPMGTKVTILETSGQWSHIRLSDGVEGYVYSQYLQPSTSASSTVLVDNLNLRVGPGAGYKVLRLLAKGQALEVTGRNTLGDWLQVRLADGAQGWVFAPYVLVNVPISSLPNQEAYGGPTGSGQPSNGMKVVVTIRDNQAVVDVHGFPASKKIVAELGLPGKNPDLKVSSGATDAGGAARLSFEMPARWSDGSSVSQENLALVVRTLDGSYSVKTSIVYYR